MRKIWTFTAAFVLITTMILSGCTTKSSNADSTASQSGNTPAAAPSGPVTISVFANPDNSRSLSREDNAFTKKLEQKFNINFQWTAVPRDGAAKRKITLANGDYPDVFLLSASYDHFSQDELLRLGRQGVAIPLNDLIDNYAPNIKKTLDSNPEYKAMNMAPDGKIYGLNQLAACYHCSYPNKMWVNTTWMKKLNIKAPKTTGDFQKMLEAFKNSDPNGNGKKDEIPLSGSIETFGVHVIPYLMNAFIYDDDHSYLIMNNGKVDFASNKPEWKQGLQYIKSLYDEGLIDPGAFTQDVTAFRNVGENDPQILGAGAGMHPAIFVNVRDGNKYSKDYDSIPPIAGPNGTAYATYNYTGNPGATFIITNKASEDVQIAMIKALDYIYTFQGQLEADIGIENVDWRKPQDGEQALDASMQPQWFQIPDEQVDKQNNAWGSMGQYNLSVEFKGSQVQAADIYTAAGYERRLFEATKNNYDGKRPKQIFPHWGVWIDSEVNIMQTSIVNYVDDNALQYITGNKSLDKDWDTYVKGFDNLNLKDYLRQMQTAYDSSAFSKQ